MPKLVETLRQRVALCGYHTMPTKQNYKAGQDPALTQPNHRLQPQIGCKLQLQSHMCKDMQYWLRIIAIVADWLQEKATFQMSAIFMPCLSQFIVLHSIVASRCSFLRSAQSLETIWCHPAGCTQYSTQLLGCNTQCLRCKAVLPMFNPFIHPNVILPHY